LPEFDDDVNGLIDDPELLEVPGGGSQ